MFIQVSDNKFRKQDLLRLRDYALKARAITVYEGYRKISISKLMTDSVFKRVLHQASRLVPNDAEFDNGWFMVCSTECDGIPVHADYAYITVNIWITPNNCIKSFEKNGIHIWEAVPPDDWTFAKFNGDSSSINDILASQKHSIAYCFNRSLTFTSKMFHATDGVSTLSGAENRRVNLSLMFKKRLL